MNNQLDQLFSGVLERPTLYKLEEQDRAIIIESCKLFLNNFLKQHPDYSELFLQKALAKGRMWACFTSEPDPLPFYFCAARWV